MSTYFLFTSCSDFPLLLCTRPMLLVWCPRTFHFICFTSCSYFLLFALHKTYVTSLMSVYFSFYMLHLMQLLSSFCTAQDMCYQSDVHVVYASPHAMTILFLLCTRPMLPVWCPCTFILYASPYAAFLFLLCTSTTLYALSKEIPF